MSKIEGVAKKIDGTAIDYVSIFNWSDGKCIGQVTPNATGHWAFNYFSNYRVGITYVANGCEPITHGAYDLTSDGLIIYNGSFTDNLDGWVNTNNHWVWVSGRAYHPLGADYNFLAQDLFFVGAIKLTVVIEVLVGRCQVWAAKNADSFQLPVTEFGVGTHTRVLYFTSIKDTTFYISRVNRIGPCEFYVDNISAVPAT